MIVVHFICDLLEGGAQKSAISLIENSRQQAKSYLVLLEDKRKYQPRDVDIYGVVDNKRRYKKMGRLGDFLLARKLAAILNEIERREGRPVDAVISHMEVTAKVLHYLKGYRKIFYIRVNLFQELNGLRGLSKSRAARREKLYQKIMNGQEVLGVSRGVLEDLGKIPITPGRSEYIYTPFDVENIRQLSKAHIDSVPGFDYIVHPTSYRNSQKRHDLLFQAIKLMKHNIKLVMLSDPVPALNQMISQYQVEDKVIVFGHVNNPYPIIKNARVSVLSSDREGLPRVLVESLIVGTPVVSTDCPSGPREIMVGALSRFLCRLGDPQDLADKLDDALDSYPSIGDEYLDPYSRKGNVDKFIHYLEEGR